MSIVENKGFSLVEVMIAVFVLAIGLLGIAGLQLTGMKNNQTAYVRTQVTLLATSLADRMRANIAGAETGDYLIANVVGTNNNCGLGYGTVIVSACSSSNLAQDDLFRWIELAKTTVPQPTASVTCTTPANVLVVAPTAGIDCPRGSKHTITVNWLEHDGTNGLAANGTTLEFQP
ncbi:MAG: type IV pilus modification protein PilV [Piscirickettsiaceae bacterium]|nr:MAG: type IV pilus modification protein PilV [Piscirickettsiaceae bacterium]